MLSHGRIPLTDAEDSAVSELLAQHEGTASLTRRDPGNLGPVLVHIGDETFEIDETGKVSTPRKKRS